MDVAPTIAYFLGAKPPAQSMGQVLAVTDDMEESKSLAVIIPAHNEAENLPSTLARIPKELIPNLRVIVVDDGSSDGSAEIALQHGADLVVSHPRNLGLGAALRSGIAAARDMDSHAAVYIDADGEYPPEQIPDLLKPIESGEADYVLGSRYLGTRERQPVSRLIANVIFTGLLCLASGRRITDGQTGFRAFSRRALECAEIIHDYNYAQVLTLDLLKKGMRMREVPISYLYEAGSHTRLGNSSRTLRSFATGSSPSTYFPESAEFYGSATFLDAPIQNAVRGRGEAENYTDAQKRQAIQKGALRILYHWAKFYMIIGQDRSSSRLIDEAWAVYVGEEVDGAYPNSLAAVAQAREGNFGREGTIDIPLRQAMDRARQAADDMDADALETATREVYSRFNAIFYLSTVRYIGRVYDDAQAGDHDALGIHQVEALAFYQSIQPDVAKANSASDETIMAYLTAEPAQITVQSRDRALAALNRTASSLLLTQDDLVARFTDDTGDGPSNVPSPDTGELDLSSSIFIPVGQEYETEGPTKSDGYYTATTNREIYQKISSDYQEIAALTNVIKEGKPLPAADITLMYEAGKHTRLGNQSRTLRSFARDPRRATDFPVAAEFYGSSSFLDTPVSRAISGRGDAEDYTDAQRRQAINKGVLRILYHWAKFYMIIGQERMSSRLIDEAWAVYVGEEVDGEYPNSLAALARAREGNFGREGTIDVPLRQAMDRARQAADDGDAAALETATQEVYSRFNAMFYLATVRYIGVTYNDVAEGKDPGTHQVEALAFYQSIQPEVAKADEVADLEIMAYLTAQPEQITEQFRDRILQVLNRNASALLLTQADLITSFE